MQKRYEIAKFYIKKHKNSDKLELNQRPKDNRVTLQSSALPAELLSGICILKNYCVQIISFQKQNRNMDSHPFYRYADSQDQLILSLNEQIQALILLKQSYATLQHYHIKISNDLNSLLTEHDQISEVCNVRIKELLTMIEEFDTKKTRLIEELRRMENERAKLILQRKNMACTCETLGSKFNLENQQSAIHQDRARELIQQSRKAEQSFECFKKIVFELEKEIALKNSEKSQLEDEIFRKKSLNDIKQKNYQALEHNTRKISQDNRDVIERNKELDQEIIHIEVKIREQLNHGKDLNEESIKKKEQLTNLYNKKEYYYRLIETEKIVKEDLQMSEQKFSHLIQKRSQELAKIKDDNDESKNKIIQQQQKWSKNRAYKEYVKNHLSQLIHGNQYLLNEMEECCMQDKKVHNILISKVGRLEISRQKIKSGILQPKAANILKERTNNIENSEFLKTANNTGKTWISELKDIENYQIK